jgi:ketosteroid isomerase-like protein
MRVDTNRTVVDNDTMDLSTDEVRIRLVRAWLETFAKAVRDRDLTAGRAMFSTDVIGFGSVAGRTSGIDDLVNRQWQQVWPVTRDFAFDMRTVAIHGDGCVSWVASEWSSIGQRPDGTTFKRRGRVTIILQRCCDERLLAIHTHYSLIPEPPL